MKLLAKNNQTFFRFTLLLLAVGGLLLFTVLNFVIHDELDEALYASELRVRQNLEKGRSVPDYTHFMEVEVISNAVPSKPVLADVLVFDPVEKEDEPYRELRSVRLINGKIYRIRILSSLVGREDLLGAVGISIIALMGLLLLGLTWLNRRFSRSLWQPFQNTLNELRGFSLAQENDLKLAQTNIDEFDELNKVIENLTEKVRADYRNLKEFTENAAHEIQTPLAIVRSKVELLIESENLSEQEMGSLGVVYQAVNRLSKLNQSLLLLAKIENHQFTDKQKISFPALISEQLTMLEELTNAKRIHIKTDFSEATLSVFTNPVLSDILVKNLLENAIRHSMTGDTIYIYTDESSFTFANPGEEAVAQPEKLFQRFQHGGKNTDSTGLGLAIVQQICVVNDWEILYSFVDSKHLFSVKFV